MSIGIDRLPSGIVKLCGMSRTEDIDVANELRPDFVGMVVDFPPSPRSVSLRWASELAGRSAVPVVAVVVEPSVVQVHRVVGALGPAAIQLSGTEDPYFVRELADRFGDNELWKVIHLPPVPAESELEDALGASLAYADAGISKLLLDVKGGPMPGGTGNALAWERLADLVNRVSLFVLLAGGLNPLNVAKAITLARPGGVDVSSGTESAPGVKDRSLMAKFVMEARASFSSLPAG